MPDTDDPTQGFATPQQPGDGWVIGNRYRVTGRIGSGGMADVFRAHDELLNRDVAVKVFRSVAAGADTAAGAERQRAELHALARLNHPNLITLYDGSVAGPDEPEARAYLVMELVEGPNLGDRIDRGPLPSEAEVRIVGAQVAEALAYVHEQGMVHRDVKPANILLGAGTGTEHVRARLSDFGIVRLIGAERLTQADSTLGTASYLAPEQARGSAVGPAADIYALGLTLIEAQTGIRSFDAPTPIEAVVARLDRDPDIPAGLPHPWPGLLRAMTARDPAARPSAAQVASALRGTGTTQFVPPVAGAAFAGAAATGATTVIPPAAGMPPVRRPLDEEPAPLPVRDEPKQRNTGLIVGLILVAALLVLGALILIATTGGDDDSPATPPTSSTPSTSQPSSTSAPRTTQSTEESTEESTPPPTETVTETEAPPETTTEAPPTTRQTTPSSTSAPPSTSSASTTAQAGDEPAAPRAASRPAPRSGGAVR